MWKVNLGSPVDVKWILEQFYYQQEAKLFNKGEKR